MSEARGGAPEERPQLPEAVTRSRIIAVLRSGDPVHLDAVVDLLAEEGFTAIELALTTPNAMSGLRRIRERVGSDVAVGAGTVTTPDAAGAAIDAGATYLLAPTVAPEACTYAAQRGIPFVPGAFTATEALAGWDAGAAAVKLFPARLLGPKVISDLRAPLPELRFIPTGGIDRSGAVEWLRGGATAVGVGSPLLGDALESGDLADLRERSRAFRDALGEFDASGREASAVTRGSAK